MNTTIRFVGLTSVIASLMAIYVARTPVQAQGTPSVTVYSCGELLSNGTAKYHYRVVNNSDLEISAVRIGYNSINTSSPSHSDRLELSNPPINWDANTGLISPEIASGPEYWTPSLYLREEDPKFAVEWSSSNASTDIVGHNIARNSFGEFSIIVNKPERAYLNGHAFVAYAVTGETTADKFIKIPMTVDDHSPPTFSISASPSIISPPDERMVPINVTVTKLTDDCDPSPIMMLESIQIDQLLAVTGTYEGADIGTDDRSFSLKASILAVNKTNITTTTRKYTINYLTQDAANKTTMANTSVLVTLGLPSTIPIR